MRKNVIWFLQILLALHQACRHHYLTAPLHSACIFVVLLDLFSLSLNCLWFPLFWSFEFGMLYWWLSIFMPLLRALHFVHAKLLCCLFTMRRFIRFTVFCGGIVPNELCVLWNAYANIIVHCWIVTVAQSNYNIII